MASILHISKEDGKGKECDKMVEKDRGTLAWLLNVFLAALQH